MNNLGKETKEIKNQPRINNCHLNVIFMCNIYMYISLKLILPQDSKFLHVVESDFYNISEAQKYKMY